LQSLVGGAEVEVLHKQHTTHFLLLLLLFLLLCHLGFTLILDISCWCWCLLLCFLQNSQKLISKIIYEQEAQNIVINK